MTGFCFARRRKTGKLMSSASEIALGVLNRLQAAGVVGTRLSVDGSVLRVDGRGSLQIPTGGRRGTWRRTVNGSILPRSVSAESRRHLVYAILQDFIQPNLLLHLDTGSLRPLSSLDPRFGSFEEVYRIPGSQRDR